MDLSERRDRLKWMEQCTQELRTSKHPRWSQVRARLEQEGIQSNDVALADYGPDGSHHGAGVIGTRDGRAFYVTLQVGDEEQHPKDYDWVFDWDELSPAELTGIFADGAMLARELLESDESAN